MPCGGGGGGREADWGKGASQGWRAVHMQPPWSPEAAPRRPGLHPPQSKHTHSHTRAQTGAHTCVCVCVCVWPALLLHCSAVCACHGAAAMRRCPPADAVQAPGPPAMPATQLSRCCCCCCCGPWRGGGHQHPPCGACSCPAHRGRLSASWGRSLARATTSWPSLAAWSSGSLTSLAWAARTGTASCSCMAWWGFARLAVSDVLINATTFMFQSSAPRSRRPC